MYLNNFKDHTDGKHSNSAITEHTFSPGHKYTLGNVKVLVREASDFKRKVKEAIAIHKTQPALNRDRGHKVPRSSSNLSHMTIDGSGHMTE